MVKSKGNWRSD